MNQTPGLGFFFYSKKQAETYYDCPLPKVKLDDGTIREYTEWVTEGIKPSGSWDDYIALGRGEVQ